MNQLIAYFGRKGVFADLLTVSIIAVGIVATLTIQRDVFPNINFEVITVTTLYPGASPDEVERLITNKIEQELKEMDGIKKLQSVSAEGRSYISIQLDPDQTDEETAKEDVRDIVDQVADLPEDAEDPVIRVAESKKNPIIEIAVSSDLPGIEHRRIARELENSIEDLPGVASVAPKGMRDVEIRVEADPVQLRRYAVTLDDIVSALRGQNTSIPGGTVEAPALQPDKPEVIVRTIGEFRDIDGVKKTVVRANEMGRAIRIQDIAQVQYALEKQTIINRADGNPSISLTVLKKEKADAIRVVDAVIAHVDREKSRYDGQIGIAYINDYSYYVRRRLKILTNNLAVGLVLVLIVLSLILPFRVALLTAIGIPFAFLGTMIVFWSSDISINLVSMFGLILVVGMIVDDAVVVMDNTFRRIEEGEEPTDAAIKGTQEVWIPIAASVATTILAFYPLMNMSGIMGKFIRFIPLGVIIALLMSLIECFFVLPHHISRWIRFDPHSEKKSWHARMLQWSMRIWDKKFVTRYVQIVELFVRRRYIVCGLTFLIFAGTLGLALSPMMKKSLFPKEGVEIFFIRTQTPVGTPLQQSETLLKPIEAHVQALPKTEVLNFTTTIGVQQQDANDPFTKRGSEYAQIAVYLTPENDRERSAQEVIDDLKKRIGDTPPGFDRLVFERVNPGPPQGKAISIGVQGEEYLEILPAVQELKKRLEERDGVLDVTDSYIAGKKEIWVKLNEAEASAAGLTAAAVGRTVRSAFEGTIATSIQQVDDEIDIRVSTNPSSRSNEKSLQDLYIRNSFGNLVPLRQISRLEYGQGIASFEHEGNRRQVKVYGEVNEKLLTSTEINNEIREWIPEFKTKFPRVDLFFGGEDEDTKESMQSLAIAFLMAFIGIFLVLVLTFENLRQPILVMMTTVPLGLMAVVWAFFLWQKPLSFMAFMGMVALAGVIVNNAIVFLSFVNSNRGQGIDRIQSILLAAKSRLRPIFLTTVTTVCGILPTAYGLGGLDPFVAPCAMALGWGVLVGAFLTTLVFPPATAIFDDASDRITRFFRPA